MHITEDINSGLISRPPNHHHQENMWVDIFKSVFTRWYRLPRAVFETVVNSNI